MTEKESRSTEPNKTERSLWYLMPFSLYALNSIQTDLTAFAKLRIECISLVLQSPLQSHFLYLIFLHFSFLFPSSSLSFCYPCFCK